uniref:Serine incorporator 2 n=1 Tax=Hippocampus comes TaxID=109280 RepID=A0A3Q2XXC1_HIPCM
MGACLALCSLASCASCLCGSAPCLLCGCCPSSNNSTVTRLVFSFFLLLGTLVSAIMILPGMETQLRKIPGFCQGGSTVFGLENKFDCDVIVGYKSVYRICFAMTCFFFLFFIIMIRVRSSKDPRAPIQNGFWFFKFLILVGITVGAFFISDPLFNTVWYYFGLVGSLLFIIIQLILLIDFAHSWNKAWVENAENNDNKCWYAGLVSFTFLNYALAFTAVVLFYVYYTQPDDCKEHKIVISLNLIFCIIISIVSILPKVQEAQPYSGLLQASLISLYTMYVTWSALTNNPSESHGVLFSVCRVIRDQYYCNSSHSDKSTKIHSFFFFYIAFVSSLPDTTTQAMRTSMPALWVKVSSSWLGLSLYLWTLVAPLIFPDRDFS